MWPSNQNASNPSSNPAFSGASTFGNNASMLGSTVPQNTLFGATAKPQPFGTSSNAFQASQPQSFNFGATSNPTVFGTSPNPFSFGNTSNTAGSTNSVNTPTPSTTPFAVQPNQSFQNFPSTYTNTGNASGSFFPSTTSTFGLSSAATPGFSTVPLSTLGTGSSITANPSTFSSVPQFNSNFGTLNSNMTPTNYPNVSIPTQPLAGINGNISGFPPTALYNQPSSASLFNKAPSNVISTNQLATPNAQSPFATPNVLPVPLANNLDDNISSSFSPGNKLLLTASLLAAKCYKSHPELYSSISFPRTYNDAHSNTTYGSSMLGYYFIFYFQVHIFV